MLIPKSIGVCGAVASKSSLAVALGNLAAGSDAHRDEIVAIEGVAPLAALLRDGGAGGKAKAAEALKNLTRGSDAHREAIIRRRRFGAARGVHERRRRRR